MQINKLTPSMICKAFLSTYVLDHNKIGLESSDGLVKLSECKQIHCDFTTTETELRKDLCYFTTIHIKPIAARLSKNIPEKAIYVELNKSGPRSAVESYALVRARVVIGTPDRISKGYLYQRVIGQKTGSSFDSIIDPNIYEDVPDPVIIRFDLLFKEI